MKGEIDEEAYFAEYKKVRNLIRKYSRDQILQYSFKFLNRNVPGENAEVRKQPWLAFLLIKWAHVDKGPFQNKKLDDRGFNRLILLTHDLGPFAGMPSEYHSVFMYMRGLSFQQFFFQFPPNKYAIARQILIFGKVNSAMSKMFSESVGISAQRFYEIATLILTHIETEAKPWIVLEWFRTVFHVYPEVEIKHVLSLMSKSRAELSEWLTQESQAHRNSYEYFEETPFIRFPLLEVVMGNGISRYICLNKNLFYRAIENFGYDFLKANVRDKFVLKFGAPFEEHVRRVIVDAGMKFIDEFVLEGYRNSGEKVVDFVIFERDANIFIDAKGIEMNARGKATARFDIIRGSTDKVRKAVLQGHSAHRILDRSMSERRAKSAFLIIVTLKEFYVGNGRNFCDITMPNDLIKLKEEYGDLSIDTINIFVLTVSEFERLIHNSARSETPLGLFLGKIAVQESSLSSGSQKFSFGLHLNDAGYLDCPLFLEEKFEELVLGVEKHFPESPHYESN